jgi:hypothetical protein
MGTAALEVEAVLLTISGGSFHMTLRRRAGAITALAASVALMGSTGAEAATSKTKLQPYQLSPAVLAELKSDFIEQIRSKHDEGTWAPMRMELSDRHLALMGLPKREVLLKQRYRKPTMVDRRGDRQVVNGPTVATYAGAGWFGIRPGALLLSITEQSIGWCTLAHVYGSPGNYQISTAGHCGNNGDRATVIAALGNRAEPVLLDFGTYSRSTGDGGVGNDWALIGINSAYQSLVTPTMAFWGGPRGVFTKTGAVAGLSFRNNNLLDPQVSVNPDPLLAQQIVHYGHGTGLGGPGVGTPRSGTAISWSPSHYMFFGAISPGDSGSGANTLTGDTVGANMEAAGIMTHIYVAANMDKGVGIMAGTRATSVGTPANGQIVPVPAPLPIVP